MNETLGWGIKNEGGIEVWDARPVFHGARVGQLETFKLLFYPKKLLLYYWIRKFLPLGKGESTPLPRRQAGEGRPEGVDTSEINQPPLPADSGPSFPRRGGRFRILDEGCGTGAAVIEMKKLWGDAVEVVGTDVIQLENEIAKQRVQEYGVDARIVLYESGGCLPFDDGYFDAAHTSDVLGHVQDVPFWLGELSRVLKPGGILAMFSESKLGKHAYIRNYLLQHGVNTDPHAEFHISLYSKQELQQLLKQAGFEIEHMYTTVWAKFFVHPILHPDPANAGEGSFEGNRSWSTRITMWILRSVSWLLFWAKKFTHPFSTALCELYCLIEMLLLGKKTESQGYIVLARKRE